MTSWKDEEMSDEMRDFLHDRYSLMDEGNYFIDEDEDEEEESGCGGYDRERDRDYDESLEELEEREYWRNVLDDELRREKR